VAVVAVAVVMAVATVAAVRRGAIRAWWPLDPRTSKSECGGSKQTTALGVPPLELQATTVAAAVAVAVVVAADTEAPHQQR